MLEQLGINAKKVAGILTTVTTEQKNNALIEISNAFADLLLNFMIR